MKNTIQSQIKLWSFFTLASQKRKMSQLIQYEFDRNRGSALLSSHTQGTTKMKIQYNKNEVIAAARYIVENKPSSKIPSDIPNTNRGYLPERGQVEKILVNIRFLAKENMQAFEAIQQQLVAGNKNVAPHWQKWVEVMGVGGYWIIANIEGGTVNFMIAVSPWFGDANFIQEEIL